MEAGTGSPSAAAASCSPSTINSRAAAIKTILMGAWRAKLSDQEWEARIRKVLPKGVNGDVYELADCLLNQALVGPVPNQLFMCYLKHAVDCKLVSYGALLASISRRPCNLNLSSSSNTPAASPDRGSSIMCLLNFIKSLRERISCDGSESECLNLSHSLSQLLHWLLASLQQALQLLSTISPTPQLQPVNQSAPNQTTTTQLTTPNTQTQQPQQPPSIATNPTNTHAGRTTELALQVLHSSTEMIHYFIQRPFTKSLLFISKIEFVQEFEENLRLAQAIQQHPTLNNLLQQQQQQHQQQPADRFTNLNVLQHLETTFNSASYHPAVIAAQQLKFLQQHRTRHRHTTDTYLKLSNHTIDSRVPPPHQNLPLLANHNINDSTINYALFNSFYSLIALEVILRPARSHKLLARQVAVITEFNSAPIDITYCELIRVCMIGLIDTEGTSTKVKWAFFSYLKLPKLLIELGKIYKSSSNSLLDSSASSSSSPIIANIPATTLNTNDFVNDLKLAFDRLREFSPLLDEAEYKCNCDFFKCLVKELFKSEPGLISLKNLELPVKRPVSSSNDSSVGGHLMLKTDPFVTSMLQTFNSEQDPNELFSLLSQFVSGKQFEFTLSCAASTGRLPMFVKKLVEYNELNRNPSADNANKNSQIQALIFDMTFLILTYIAQQYGPEVIRQNQHSTFNRWFYDCYNPETRINCPKEMLKNYDSEVVNNLLRQLASPDSSGLQIKSANLREVCANLPKAISELLVAWSQNYLTDDNIHGIIEKIKSKLCFAAVVSATWLQSHIRTLCETDKAKPLYFLRSLTKASQSARHPKQPQMISTNENSSAKSESYFERSSLMCSIIRKIYFELVPKAVTNPTNHSNSNLTNNLTSNPTTTTTTTTTNGNNGHENEEATNESAYQSYNDKFVSTLTSQEIFLANVKQCLDRGWIDHKSLISLSSLFKMIGCECFVNLLVEQILASHESPSDLSRALNITFGLFHLDIEGCAFALLQDTIPSWLMGEKKQALLNQPRAFALAHLTVMTITEVFINLKTNQSSHKNQAAAGAREKKQLNMNGIKQENSPIPPIIADNSKDASDGSMALVKDSKRLKLTLDSGHCLIAPEHQAEDISKRIDKLNDCIANLMRLFRRIMSDTVMSQRTLFPVLFLQQVVVCTREKASTITVHLQPEILLDIIKLFSSELTFELVLAISNLSTTNSRKYAAKAMCLLAKVKETNNK